MKDFSIMKKHIGFITFILCVFVVSGCSTDVPKLIEQGKNAFYSGNYSKAKDAFGKRYLLKAASEGSNLAKETLSMYGSFLQYY